MDSDYLPLEVIGRGSFGIIRKVRRQSDNKILVRKEIDYRRMTTNEKRQLCSEVNILRNLRHTNIVRYYERFIDKENGLIYIIMEYCQGGDLSAIIQRCRAEGRLIPEDIVWNILSQLVLALHECHFNQQNQVAILHRDIKPENVFLDAEQNVKLGDFGLSRQLESPEVQFARTFVGTPYYMSPEIVNETTYNMKSDIWALGCLAYEMCSLRPPFQAKTQTQLNNRIKMGEIDRVPSMYSNDLFQLVRSMLLVDQDKRPLTLDLMRHEKIKFHIQNRQIQSSQNDLDRKLAEVNQREEKLREREVAVEKREQKVERMMEQVQKAKEIVAKVQKSIGLSMRSSNRQISFDENITEDSRLITGFEDMPKTTKPAGDEYRGSPLTDTTDISETDPPSISSTNSPPIPETPGRTNDPMIISPSVVSSAFSKIRLFSQQPINSPSASRISMRNRQNSLKDMNSSTGGSPPLTAPISSAYPLSEKSPSALYWKLYNATSSPGTKTSNIACDDGNNENQSPAVDSVESLKNQIPGTLSSIGYGLRRPPFSNLVSNK